VTSRIFVIWLYALSVDHLVTLTGSTVQSPTNYLLTLLYQWPQNFVSYDLSEH